MTSPADTRRPAGHEGLLSYRDGSHLRSMQEWVRSAAGRTHKIVALAPPAGPDPLPRGVAATALAPDLRDPAAQLHHQLRNAVDEGFTGMGVVVWADNVVAATSVGFHTVVEAALDQLCREGPVSVLCLYDRTRAELLDMAVGQHADGLHDATLTVRRRAGTLLLAGEIDMDNLAVLDAALDTAEPDHLDLADVRFLSAAAVQRIGRCAAAGVRVHGARPPVRRMLHLSGGTG